MSQPGYQEGGERVWWWRVAKHLDSAQLAAVNAMAHNADDQALMFAFGDKLREAQVILLDIFGVKGLLPGAPNEGPPSSTAHPSGPPPMGPPMGPPTGPPTGPSPMGPPPMGPPPMPSASPMPGMTVVFVPPVPESIGDVYPPHAATIPPPMIVTDDVPRLPDLEPPVQATETER